MPPQSSHLRALALTSAVSICLACGGGDSDPPPLPPVAPAPPPFPSATQRGIAGTYSLTGGEWAVNPAAYSYRYQNAFDRLSVYRAPRTRCDALRLTQPAGYGPPIEGRQNRFAIVEVEAYDRPDSALSEYRHEADGNLLGKRTLSRVRADGSRQGTRPEATVDGRVASPEDGPMWASADDPQSHWIQFTFRSDVVWNQLAVYWPMFEQPGPWARDIQVVEGLRSQMIVVQARRDGEWHTVPLEELRPGARHDGYFMMQWMGLDREPASGLAHLDEICRWRSQSRRDPTLRPEPGETAITEGWKIRLVDGSPALVRLAADELQAWLGDAMGCASIPITARAPDQDPDSGIEPPSIVLGLLDRAPRAFADALAPGEWDELRRFCDRPEAFAILVEPSRIWALGVDSLGARYAACRLEEHMTNRGAPFLRRGLELRRPAFYPRVSSGISFGAGGPDGLGFPDAYLSLMAHYYLDALYLFQAGPYLDVTSVVGSALDPSLGGDPLKQRQITSLVRRAARQGLGVYWCVALPGFLPPGVYSRHPEIRGEHPMPHVICLSTPAGRAFVEDAARRIPRAVPGLSGLVILRTELSHTCGGRNLCDRCRRVTDPDHDPAQRIFEWVADTAREVDPDIEIIAFDWRGGGIEAPDESRLPRSVDYWIRPDRFDSGTPENDIRDVEPHATFKSLMRTHHPARRIWVEGQFSHPFPCHTEPELPVADLYWEKWMRLRELSATQPNGAPLVAVAAGNGSGFAPTSMQDLGLRVLLWEPIGSRDEELGRLAARWYGSGADGDVRAAWWAFSRALREHARFEKYLTRASRTRLPGFEDSNLTPEQLASVELLTGEWGYGLERLKRAVSRADVVHRLPARNSFAMAEGAMNGFVSLRNALRWAVAFGPLDPLEARQRLPAARHPEAVDILEDEWANMRRTIEISSQYGLYQSHPYYRNWFSLPVLVSKERRLAHAIGLLSEP